MINIFDRVNMIVWILTSMLWQLGRTGQLYDVPVTHQGYLTIAWDDRIIGRIELLLFGKTVPKTVNNWV